MKNTNMLDNNKIVLDLETQKTFDEVGGDQSNHHLLKISFVGVYSYSQDKYFGFYEKDLPVLEKIFLKEKPTIIGFNTISFDNKVLQPYFQKCNISNLPQLDILKIFYEALGFRVKLDNIAIATLGEGKSGSGLDAIKYFRTGNWEALTKYCIDDVRVTKGVYEYGLRHGFIMYPTGGEYRRAAVTWGEQPSISDLVRASEQEHKRLKVRYWEFVDDVVIKTRKREMSDRVIEVRSLAGSNIVAFCHTIGSVRNFILEHILEAELLQENFAHQSSLL